MKRKNIKFGFNGLEPHTSPLVASGEQLSVVHNLRKRIDGSLESVCRHSLLYRVAQESEFEILGRHDYIGRSTVFVARKDDALWRVELSDGEIVPLESIFVLPAAYSGRVCELFFFGNMMFVSVGKSGRIEQQWVFQWYRSSYHRREIDSLPIVKPSKIDYVYGRNSTSISKIPPVVVDALLNTKSTASDGSYSVELYDYRYKEQLDQFINQDLIYGAVYLIFAYKLIDGSIVKHSPVYMCDAQRELGGGSSDIYYNKVGDYMFYYQNLYAFRPKFTFQIDPSVLNNPLVESIVVFSSRNNPLYVYEDIYNQIDYYDPLAQKETIGSVVYTRLPASRVIDKDSVEVAHAPFYRIADLDFRESQTIELSFREHYNNIEQCEVFVPNISNHSLMGNVKYEYNSRLHIADVSMRFCGGDLFSAVGDKLVLGGTEYLDSKYTTGRLVCRTTIVEAGEECVSEGASIVTSYYIDDINDRNKYIILPNHISYPDPRAIKISIFFRDHLGKTYFVKEFALKKALENGYAYYQNLSQNCVMGYTAYTVSQSETEPLPVVQSVANYTNRIAVSAISNAMVFEYANMIDVANRDTVIYAVGCVAKELSVESYGDFPLYLFTNDGVYALQSGSGVQLYSRIVRVNNQLSDSSLSCVSAGDRLYFTTSRGLYAISGSVCEFVSAPIEDYLYGGVTFAEYADGAKLTYVARYGEVVIRNEAYGYCYVYSTDDKRFYTRDLSGRSISSHLISDTEGIYTTIGSENILKPLVSRIESVASCFGSEKLKSIMSFELLGAFKSNSQVVICGSNDLLQWFEIKKMFADKGKYGKSIGAWKYIRFVVESKYMKIDGVDIDIMERT